MDAPGLPPRPTRAMLLAVAVAQSFAVLGGLAALREAVLPFPNSPPSFAAWRLGERRCSRCCFPILRRPSRLCALARGAVAVAVSQSFAVLGGLAPLREAVLPFPNPSPSFAALRLGERHNGGSTFNVQGFTFNGSARQPTGSTAFGVVPYLSPAVLGALAAWREAPWPLAV